MFPRPRPNRHNWLRRSPRNRRRQRPTRPRPIAAAPATDAQAPEEPVGNVATVTGKASVIRNDPTTPLKVKDDIYLNDIVQTAANSALGITFIDATTFNLKASAKITIDNYVYEDGGKNNAAIFDVAKGTAAFVAASVAKTGDMKITTPTATLGIRGTTGLVEVPEGAAANNPNNVAIKLYPDADGRVGRIEVNDRAGARLGFLTQGASGFTIRPGSGGVRFAAVPLAIPASGGFARPGFCAAAPRDAESRTPDGVPAARIPPRQSQLRQSEPSEPAAAARSDRGRMARRDKSGPDNRSAGQPNRPDSSSNPVDRPGRTPAGAGQHRTAQGEHRSSRARRTQPGTPPRAGQPQRPGQPNQPGLPPRDGTAAAIRSAGAARPAATRGPTATTGCAGATGRAAGTARTATGSAFPDCNERRRVQGAPALQRPGSPAPRRPAPHRNGASRRRRNCGSARSADQAARRSQSRIR